MPLPADSHVNAASGPAAIPTISGPGSIEHRPQRGPTHADARDLPAPIHRSDRQPRVVGTFLTAAGGNGHREPPSTATPPNSSTSTLVSSTTPGRHREQDTTPGSSTVQPSKKRAISAGD